MTLLEDWGREEGRALSGVMSRRPYALEPFP
jgi:hypothetical protein